MELCRSLSTLPGSYYRDVNPVPAGIKGDGLATAPLRPCCIQGLTIDGCFSKTMYKNQVQKPSTWTF